MIRKNKTKRITILDGLTAIVRLKSLPNDKNKIKKLHQQQNTNTSNYRFESSFARISSHLPSKK